MLERGKSYSVKDWFANKIAQEVKFNTFHTEIFDILKETERAAYVIVSLGSKKRKTMWIPKSALVVNEVGHDEFDIMHYETKFISDYDEAIESFEEFWESFM